MWFAGAPITELRKAREREHILLGFQLALDNIDEVIRLIRAAKSPKEARDALVQRRRSSTSTKFISGRWRR